MRGALPQTNGIDDFDALFDSSFRLGIDKIAKCEKALELLQQKVEKKASVISEDWIVLSFVFFTVLVSFFCFLMLDYLEYKFTSC